jgi:hypothetical protein
MMLRWQKGYAVDCRSINPGSIPGLSFEVFLIMK